MFFRWLPPFAVRYDRTKARRAKETVKLSLEVLEDRTMPSVVPGNAPPIVSVASPPAAPQVAVIASSMVSAMEQEINLYALLRQDASNAIQAFDQEMALLVSFAEQQWGGLFGFQATASNQVPGAPMPQANSGSGSDSGAMTTTPPPVPSQPLNTAAPKSGGDAIRLPSEAAVW